MDEWIRKHYVAVWGLSCVLLTLAVWVGSGCVRHAVDCDAYMALWYGVVCVACTLASVVLGHKAKTANDSDILRDGALTRWEEWFRRRKTLWTAFFGASILFCVLMLKKLVLSWNSLESNPTIGVKVEVIVLMGFVVVASICGLVSLHRRQRTKP